MTTLPNGNIVCPLCGQVGSPPNCTGCETDSRPHSAAAKVGNIGSEAGVCATHILHDKELIERCARELEAAYAECNTLSLLHGAARIRALKDKL